MSDLDRARSDLDEIPAQILIRDRVPPEALAALRARAEIPVLNIGGEQLANWSEARFLKALAVFRESPHFVESEAKVPPAKLPDVTGRAAAMTFAATESGSSGGAQRWLGEILLGALPYALFATDLQGNTLFYNGRFEEDILTKRALKNSIRLAETFFLELTRTLLAQSFEEDPLRKQRNALTTYHAELQVRVRVLNLEQDGRIQGYLYLFQGQGEGELFHELVDRIGRGQGLEDVIDEVEGQFIYLMLERHGQNVSHTSRALKIKRSTLQNKIKRLRIDERYNRKIEGPVRRHRRTVAEILAERESAPEVGAASAAKKSSKQVAKKARKRTAKKITKKVAKKTAQKAGKKIGKKTTKNIPKKAAQKPTKKVGNRSSKKAAAGSGRSTRTIGTKKKTSKNQKKR